MLIILFFSHLLFFATAQSLHTNYPPATRWIVESNSSLNIEGRSNVSPFRCEVMKYLNADTLEFVRDDTKHQFIFVNSFLTIDINCFDCHQRFITSDFRKTLKADQNRYLKIHFVSMDAFDWRSRQPVKGRVEIQLAGVTKQITIDFITNPTGIGRIQLNGTKTVLFSDFNLTPPRKLAGFIRTEEEIRVNFLLSFKAIES